MPVNGDFESGYGDSPAEVAETMRRTIDAGVAGCSIEDQDQGAAASIRSTRRCGVFPPRKEAVAEVGRRISC